jgi:hypothetical protein
MLLDSKIKEVINFTSFIKFIVGQDVVNDQTDKVISIAWQ